MPNLVCSGALLRCSLGTVPTPLLSQNAALDVGGLPVATVLDMTPAKNVLPFGACLVTGTPKPCVPTPTGPWAPGATTTIGGVPAMSDADRLICGQGGVISPVNTGGPIIPVQ